MGRNAWDGACGRVWVSVEGAGWNGNAVVRAPVRGSVGGCMRGRQWVGVGVGGGGGGEGVCVR